MNKLYITAYLALTMIPILSYSNITERESISLITSGQQNNQSSPVITAKQQTNNLCGTKVAKYLNECHSSYYALAQQESCPYRKS